MGVRRRQRRQKRRRERTNKEEEKSRTTKNLLHITVCMTVLQAKMYSLNFTGTETKKVPNWFAWGHHIQSPQAVLYSHLPSHSRLTLSQISPPQLYSTQTGETSQPSKQKHPFDRATLHIPSTKELYLQASQSQPEATLPLQVLGCGNGSRMVLGGTWEDSGLSADSSAASGCGGRLSVPGRAKRRGRSVSHLQSGLRP